MLSRRGFLSGTAATCSAALAAAGVPSRGVAHRPGTTRLDQLLADDAQQHEVRTFDIAYRRDAQRAWLARLYQPTGDGPFAGLVSVHGGTWTDFDRTSDEPIHQALAARGVVVAAIDFHTAPADPYPAAMIDLNYATRWLKAHATEYKIAPRAIGGFGSSAGGQMVMLSAMRPRDRRYSALPLAEGPTIEATLAYVVLHSPVIAPVARYAYAQATGRTDIWPKQDGYFVTLDAMHESDPRLILDRGEEVDLPPTLLIHGTADLNVPIAHVEDFAQAYRSAYLQRLVSAADPDVDAAAPYRAAGGVLELAEFADLPHVFVNPGLQPAVAQADRDHAVDRIERFIARQTAELIPASEQAPASCTADALQA